MDDWTILIRNATAVVIILATIALVMFLAFLGINSVNKGGQKLSESVSALDDRAFETYSQTTVSGNVALAAAKNYKNTSVGVVIIVGSGTGQGHSMNYCARFGTWTGDTSFSAISTTNNFTIGTSAKGDGVVLTNSTATVIYTVNPDLQNNNLRNAQLKNDNYYINPSARFKSCVIYNANGEGIGILLVQTLLTNRAATLP